MIWWDAGPALETRGLTAVDEVFMARAMELARKGLGYTSPNPAVGAVVVNGGRIVGEGYHRQAGGAHAEVYALQDAGREACGSTLYVTLEPCGHHGRTPPCTESVIGSGVRRVVTAMVDPNPLVAGKGIGRLRQAGVTVDVGVLGEKARRLNEGFIKHVLTRRPFVIMKVAMTLDGKIATCTGDSRWVTGEEARRQVHLLREQSCGVMVGIGTILADDPLLTTRLPERQARSPRRIILDSRLRIPVTAKVVTGAREVPTIVATTVAARQEKIRVLEDSGVTVLIMHPDHNRVNLSDLLTILGRDEMTSILLEGGSTLNAAMLAAHLVDKVIAFVAPKIVGGERAPGPVGGQGMARMEQAIGLKHIEVSQYGQDLAISGYMAEGEGNVHRIN